ncbi:MAG: hypothetical protein US70_C0005G0020 [Parcubacteria group bacterium GW2011_GWD2_38_11]|nr:MAG: hypothetical protein US70_C0005G0020 [Parcubacteria group bacterium GW2011_GWD2_38_11]
MFCALLLWLLVVCSPSLTISSPAVALNVRIPHIYRRSLLKFSAENFIAHCHWFKSLSTRALRDFSSPKLSRDYAEKVFLRSLGFKKRKIVCVFKIPFKSLRKQNKKQTPFGGVSFLFLCALRDLNPRPSGSKPDTLSS